MIIQVISYCFLEGSNLRVKDKEQLLKQSKQQCLIKHSNDAKLIFLFI